MYKRQASTLLKDNPDIEKCLFVVDRKDLDRQTREEFNRFQEGCVEANTNTAALVQRLLAMVQAIRTAAASTIPAGETTWGAVFIANGLQLIIAVLLIVLGATIVVNSMRSYVASKHNSEVKA